MAESGESLTIRLEHQLEFTRVALAELSHLELPPSSKLQVSGFVGREAELAEIGSRSSLPNHHPDRANYTNWAD